MLIAVLERRCGLRLAAEDVFVNIAGGVKVVEPAIDLAIALAIASAHLNRPLTQTTLAVGELGLAGEVRSISQLEQRINEATRLGVKHAVIPASCAKSAPKTLPLSTIRHLSAAMELLA
jgi:DNA repair protein RadA/Sms